MNHYGVFISQKFNKYFLKFFTQTLWSLPLIGCTIIVNISMFTSLVPQLFHSVCSCKFKLWLVTFLLPARECLKFIKIQFFFLLWYCRECIGVEFFFFIKSRQIVSLPTSAFKFPALSAARCQFVSYTLNTLMVLVSQHAGDNVVIMLHLQVMCGTTIRQLFLMRCRKNFWNI